MLSIGQRILGRYTVTDLIGSGGQSEILLASEDAGHRCVVKRLISDVGDNGHARRLARFRRESAIRIGHPRVVEAIDAGSDGNDHFIVFPFIEGADLATVLHKQQGPLPIREAVELTIGIADAVAALHKAGYVHRDLKPENIIIDSSGHPHLIDLGIARSLGEHTITAPETTLLGTPAWMSPEQFERTDVDQSSDVFSIGLLMYRALTGDPPRQGSDAEDLRQQSLRPLAPPSTRNSLVGPELDEVCLTAVSIDPARRMSDAGELVEHLRRATPERCLACGARIPARSQCCPGCRRVIPPARPRLEFADGQVFLIPDGEYETGRMQIRPEDNRLSRKQCRVECNGQVRVIDLSTPNPTRVGGSIASTPARLNDGAHIHLAKRSAVFAVDSPL